MLQRRQLGQCCGGWGKGRVEKDKEEGGSFSPLSLGVQTTQLLLINA